MAANIEKLRSAVGKFNATLADRNIYCFTSDIDWASEYAIEETLKIFDTHKIKATVFATHESPKLKSALKDGKIELGIHPNFMPDSSQGKDFAEVIDFCLNLVPDAAVFRSHRYFEVNDIVESLVKRGIKYSSNICTMMENTYPYVHRCSNVSFPVYLEDGAYLLNGMNLNFGEVKNKFFADGGLKVINMHPMHLMLNTPYFKYTRDIKDKLSRDEWRNLDAAAIRKLDNTQIGIRNFMESLFGYVNSIGAEIKTLGELYEEIQKYG